MSKLGYVLLGVVLALGALSLGSYRHVYKPFKERENAQSRPAPSSAARSIQSGPSGQRQSPTSGSSPVSTSQMFDWGLNIANLVVGLVGIWLALTGIRARR